MSLRFNWDSLGSVGMIGLASVDFWNGIDKSPFHIEFNSKVSLVKTLPVIADIIADRKPSGQKLYTLPDGVPLTENSLQDNNNFLIESKSYNLEEITDAIIDMIAMPNFSKGKI